MGQEKAFEKDVREKTGYVWGKEVWTDIERPGQRHLFALLWSWEWFQCTCLLSFEAIYSSHLEFVFRVTLRL